MTTTTRGRYRAARTARHLGNAVWVAAILLPLLIIAAALTANAAPAQAAPGVQAEYGGSRWQHAGRPICVTLKNIKSKGIKDAVKRSIAKWNEHTVLDVRGRHDCYASGYSQRIVVYDGYYKFNASGWSDKKGGFKWYQAKTAGPWTTTNGWTYAHQSPVIVKINRRYTDGSSSWRQHTVSHELAHALGLGHTQKCAIVTQNKNCKMYLYGGYWDFVGTTSNPGINTIYKNG